MNNPTLHDFLEKVFRMPEVDSLSLVFRVTDKDRRELLPRHEVVRAAVSVAIAENDAVERGPFDALGVPFALRDVRERTRVGDFGPAFHAVEDREDAKSPEL